MLEQRRRYCVSNFDFVTTLNNVVHSVEDEKMREIIAFPLHHGVLSLEESKEIYFSLLVANAGHRFMFIMSIVHDLRIPAIRSVEN